MFNWLTFPILKYIAAGLAAAVIALSVALWAQGVRVGKAQNERDAAVQRVAQALFTIDGYKTAVAACNDNTRKLEQASAEKLAAADQAVAKARADSKKHQPATERRDAALKAPTPAGKGCKDALADVRKDLK